MEAHVDIKSREYLVSLHLPRASHVCTQVEREKHVTDFQRNDTNNLGIYAARYLKCKFIFSIPGNNLLLSAHSVFGGEGLRGGCWGPLFS